MEPSPRIANKFSKPTIQYIVKGKKIPKFFTIPDVLKMEYFSDKFYDLPMREQVEILQKLHLTQPVRRKIGVLFAGVVADDNSETAGVEADNSKVAVGFSLCHNTMDEFDKTNTGTLRKINGLGLKIAMSNALRWKDKKFVMEPIPKECCIEIGEEYLQIPTIAVNNKHSNLLQFIKRIKKRYKDKTLPAWCEHLLQVCQECEVNEPVR